MAYCGTIITTNNDMKKLSIIVCMSLIGVLANAQVYFYGSSLMAEYEDAPDSVVTIPAYHTSTPAQNVGALSGVFSVSNTRKIRFSRGNLQYETTTGVWRFATNQYDTVGGNVSNQFIDVFGYGTSGWAGSGATAYQPTATSTNSIDYTVSFGGITLSSLEGYMEQRDWGVHNPVLNGGNKAGLWRLLTNKEMSYLLGSRWEPYAYALVNGVFGIVLLPDDWDDARNPNDHKIHATFKYDRNWREHTTLTDEEIDAYFATYGNDTVYVGRIMGFIGYDQSYGIDGTRDFIEYTEDYESRYPLESYNVTPEEWLQFESLGCVFLPFVTSRNNPRNSVRIISEDVKYEMLYSIYWTKVDGYALNLRYETYGYNGNYRPIRLESTAVQEAYIGGCVRLVQDY